MQQEQKDAALTKSPDENMMVDAGIGRELHVQEQQREIEPKIEDNHQLNLEDEVLASLDEDNIHSDHNYIATETQNSRTKELGCSIQNYRTPLHAENTKRHATEDSTMERRKKSVEWTQNLNQEPAVRTSPTPQKTEAKHSLDTKMGLLMAVKRRRRSREVTCKISAPEEQIKHDGQETKNTPINRPVPETTRDSNGKAEIRIATLGNKYSNPRAVKSEGMDGLPEKEEQKISIALPTQRAVDVRLKAEIHEYVRKRQRKMREHRFKKLKEKVGTKETANFQPIPPHASPATGPIGTTQLPINVHDHTGLDQALVDVQNAALVIQNAALSIQSAAGTLFETVAVLRNKIAQNTQSETTAIMMRRDPLQQQVVKDDLKSAPPVKSSLDNPKCD